MLLLSTGVIEAASDDRAEYRREHVPWKAEPVMLARRATLTSGFRLELATLTM
jgi:hypothetical protein